MAGRRARALSEGYAARRARSRSKRGVPMHVHARRVVHRPDHRDPADPDGARGGQVRSRSSPDRARACARRRDRRAQRRARELLRTRKDGHPAHRELTRVRQDARGARHPRADRAPPGPPYRRRHAAARLPRGALPDEHRRGLLHRLQRRGVRPRRPRAGRQARGSVDGGGELGVLRAHLRSRLRAGPPDPALCLGRYEGVGGRERDADPAGRRPQARVRALRGDGRELPARDGRRRRRLRPPCHRRPHRQGRHRRRHPAAGRGAARRPARLTVRGTRTPSRLHGHHRRCESSQRIPSHPADRGERQRLDPGGDRQGADRQPALEHRHRAGGHARGGAADQRTRRRLAADRPPRAGDARALGRADRAGQPPQAAHRSRAPDRRGDG